MWPVPRGSTCVTWVPWPLTEGSEGPERVGEARTPGLLSLPARHRGLPALRSLLGLESQTLSASERSDPPSPPASTPGPSLQESPRLPVAECVCTSVCTCVSGHCPSNAVLLGACGCPSLPAWSPQPHPIIPVLGDLSFLVSLPQSGNPASCASPRESGGVFICPFTHPCAIPFFSPRSGKGARPRA